MFLKKAQNNESVVWIGCCLRLRAVLLQERGPLPGPETGLLSNTQKWIAWRDTSADKARDFIGKGHAGGEQEGKGTRRPALPHGSQSGFMVMGLVSGLSLANHSNSGVLPGGASFVHPRWMPDRRMLGGGRTCGVSFWPFLNSSGWWGLISSVFLARTSCHKTTHANGCYGAWPGWAASVSVLPLTLPCVAPTVWHALMCWDL